MDHQQEYVLDTIESRDIGYIRLWFTDVVGNLKSVAMTANEVPGAFAEGCGFDGSAIDGFSRVQESDMVVFPDPATLRLLPWKDGTPGPAVARMFGDVFTPDGEPFNADPRQVLRRNLSVAEDMGFTMYVHPEIEFYLLHSIADPTPIDRGGYFDSVPDRLPSVFRSEAVDILEAMGIPVEYSHHEVSPGQHEIDLRYADALTCADNIVTFRHVIKQVALKHGIHATFMPKPIAGAWGSAMHTHLSLFEGDHNAFNDPDQPYGLSRVAQQFMAGLLRHAKEITAVTNQWINSYKRLVPGYEAPVHVCWGASNRSSLIRVPRTKPNKASSRRIEYRSPDPACNPYLAFSVILAAGLEGIRQGYELPPEAANNLYEMSPAELRAANIELLPITYSEALIAMEESELVAQALGEHVFEYFLRNKWNDWDEYRRQVTPYELERFLPVL
ncbi:glutamine synthetase family protein [Stomatohabitans albus]|uniref:glutamine synthetase family protein n=1 Tax=Stomatohabitans albus TaxID=3110766 RepID=UPI00300C091C